MKTIIWLILFFPYGMYRMWKYEEWPQAVKAGVSVLIVAALVVGLRQQQKGEVMEEVPQTLALNQANLQTIAERSMGGALIKSIELNGESVAITYKTKEDYFLQGAGIEKSYLTTTAILFSNFEGLNNVKLTSVQNGKTYDFEITYPEFEQYTTFSRKSLREHWDQYDKDFVYDNDKRLLFFERFLK